MACIPAWPATPLSHVPIGPKTGGFASPPYDGFALTLRSQLIRKRTRWQSVRRSARRQIATSCPPQIHGESSLRCKRHRTRAASAHRCASVRRSLPAVQFIQIAAANALAARSQALHTTRQPSFTAPGPCTTVGPPGQKRPQGSTACPSHSSSTRRSRCHSRRPSCSRWRSRRRPLQHQSRRSR